MDPGLAVADAGGQPGEILTVQPDHPGRRLDPQIDADLPAEASGFGVDEQIDVVAGRAHTLGQAQRGRGEIRLGQGRRLRGKALAEGEEKGDREQDGRASHTGTSAGDAAFKALKK